jgi:outer membrane protein TolC
MQSPWRRWVMASVLAASGSVPGAVAWAQEPARLPAPTPHATNQTGYGGLPIAPVVEKAPASPASGTPAPCPDPLQGPVLSTTTTVTTPAPVFAPEQTNALPINLATALRLANARPLIIATAQASVKVALAELEQAQVLWLPNLYLGGSYYRHDGGGAGNSGQEFTLGRDQFMAGYGFTAVVAATDAIFAPLAARQVVRAREADVLTARNDALLRVAEAYFNVQQARGRLAGSHEAVEKGRALDKQIQELAKDLVPPIESNRVRAQLAQLRQAEASASEDWRVASAALTRELRLAPTAVIAPLEPAHLQVTLFSPQLPVDDLIPVGLMGRPELASQQALVQATLIRLRQEKLRPLIPSLVLLGDATPAAPGGYLMGGAFLSDARGQANPTTYRNDPSVQLLWEFRNLGLGNRALVNQRRAEMERTLLDLYRIQDMVAEEITTAHAQLQSAAQRLREATTEVQQAQVSYQGNVKGLTETYRFGDRFALVVRPQEAVAALQELLASYDDYFRSIGDYNRAQFRLYRALGYPADILSCGRPMGDILPVDTTRPPQMAPAPGPAVVSPSH